MIPIKKGGKKPPIEWKPYQHARADEETIRSWWDRWPDASMGIVTGAVSGLIVLDIDGPDGMESLKKYNLHLPPTPTAQTGGGGLHYFFKHPGYPCKNFTKKYPGIDFRGDGGYVVAPPSLHPSGNYYRWLITPWEEEPADAPAWLLDLIEKQESGGRLEPSEWTTDIPQGKRNDELTRRAGSLLARGIPPGEVFTMLLAVNEKHCKPPLPEGEIKAIVESIAKKEAQKRQKNDHELSWDATIPSDKSNKKGKDGGSDEPCQKSGEGEECFAEPEGNDIICFADVEAKEVEWLGPFPKGMLGTVQGDPGGGKTYVMTKICADITNGILPPDEWDDVHHIEPQNVVIVNGEDDPSYTIKPRLIKAKANCSRVFTMDERRQPFSFDQLARVENLMSKVKPALVIFDPLQQFLGQKVDMHRANEVRPILASLANIMARYKAACILVMHMNKYGGGKAQYRGLGSIDFSAIARTQFLVGEDRNSRGDRLFIQIKNNLGKMQLAQGFRIDNDGVHWTGVNLNATEKDILKEAAVKEGTALDEAITFCRRIINEAPIWSTDLEELAAEEGISKRTLERAKSALQDSWEADSEKQGKRWLFRKRNKKVDFSKELAYMDDIDEEQEK